MLQKIKHAKFMEEVSKFLMLKQLGDALIFKLPFSKGQWGFQSMLLIGVVMVLVYLVIAEKSWTITCYWWV